MGEDDEGNPGMKGVCVCWVGCVIGMFIVCMIYDILMIYFNSVFQ